MKVEKNCTIYTAEDGTLFSSAVECIEYETKLEEDYKEDVEKLLDNFSYGNIEYNIENIQIPPIKNIDLKGSRYLEQLEDEIQDANIICIKPFKRKSNKSILKNNSSIEELVNRTINKGEFSIFFRVNGIWIEYESIIALGKQYIDRISNIKQAIINF